MYIPKGWHWIGPTSLVLGGFYIRQHYGAHWDVFVFVQLPLSLIATEWGAYIWQAGVAYQRYLTSTNTTAPPPEAETAGELIDWNTGRVIQRTPVLTTMSQTVEQPRFDAERKVARTLIDQRNHNMEVDLTEAFWIKRGNFGESREKFVAMKDRWRQRGIIRKAGDRKNAPDEVADWRQVRLIAGGNRLPN